MFKVFMRCGSGVNRKDCPTRRGKGVDKRGKMDLVDPTIDLGRTVMGSWCSETETEDHMSGLEVLAPMHKDFD